MLRRVLVANRGEIAIRVMRACREAGISTVAVYSEADAEAPHVLHGDTAVCIGAAPSPESYLNIPHLLDAAAASGADAVHPGYGFLAENAAFARAVTDANLTFIGPTADAIAAMGDKTQARRLAAAAGVPVVPADESHLELRRSAAPEPDREGTPSGELSGEAADHVVRAAQRVGYPLLIKAAAGGGGKGMRVVRSPADLLAAYAAAGREARSAFGDERVFMERYIEHPRHVEVQILGDHHGTILHLGERECSIQRRHQKIIEETPSPAVTPTLRNAMTEAAIAVARSVGYRSAGTVEFLLTPDGEFYFLEVNTRLQVEHPITELATGVDLVQAQLRIATGEPLWLRQDDIAPRGHAIECRICAEDPANGFLPSPGTIVMLREPHGPGIRVDSGIRAGFTVPLYYDSMLSKVSVWAETRDAACRRMLAALRESVILGCTTAIPFLIDVLEHPAFVAGESHTQFIDEHFPSWRSRDEHKWVAAVAAAIDTLPAPRLAAMNEPHVAQTPWTTLGRWRLGEA